MVISPGGSVVYTEKAMLHLQNISKIIYLVTPFELIQKRVADVPRGIVRLGSNTLEELFHERTFLYEKWAAGKVDATQDERHVVGAILEAYSQSL